MGDQVSTRPSASSIFGEDGKLSSASAATAIKYAKPQDLPSYPSTGGVKLSSANAAANLANKNQKPFEYWKPDAIPAANKAAMLAKDYTMQPLWQPGSTKAGSNAAKMAHANPTEIGPLQPPASRYKSQSAAETIVQRQRAASLSSQQASKPRDNNSWALQAAAKSHKDGASTPSAPSVSGDPSSDAARIQNAPKDDATRQRYTAAPVVGMDAQEKHRQDMLKASAIAMARKMFLIQQQHIDEAAGRTAGSKQATKPGGSIMGASSYYASDNLSAVGGGYENLEEAARRLAQERLAKIHDEHAEYRQYYGAQPSTPPRSRLSVRLRRRTSAANARDDDSDEEQSRRIRSQMSIFQSKLAEVDSKKRQQDRDALLVIAHRNVDAQISKLDEKVFQETGKASPAQMEKWERAAREKAQRDSDERMQHTGKVHIGGGKYIDQSEVDAIARARLQPTLDDIAYKADQQRARDEEARLEKIKKENELQAEKTRVAAANAEAKVAAAKLREEEKALRDAGKREQKELSTAEKQRRRETLAAEKERERLEKEEQRKLNPERPGRLSSFLSRGSSFGANKGATTAAAEPGSRDDADASDDSRSAKGDEEPSTFHEMVTEPTAESENAIVTTVATEKDVDPLSTDRPSVNRTSSLEKTTSLDEEKEGATSPSPKNKSRVKSWMRVRFRSKSGTQMPVVTEQDTDESKALNQEGGVDEGAAKDSSRPESMRDVAMAGRTSHESDDLYGPPREVSPAGSKGSQEKVTRERSASISSLSSHYSEHNKNGKPEEATIEEAKMVEIKPQTSQEPTETEADGRGRSGFKARLLRKITPQKTVSKDDKAVTAATTNAATIHDATTVPTNETNEGSEEFEEARDTFEEEKSSPPQASSTAAGENKEDNTVTKTVSPKTSREGSRFTEDL